MARIEQVVLDPITFDVGNAILAVHFTVEFNRSDRDANTPYELVCKLKGHDPVGGESSASPKATTRFPTGSSPRPGA